MTYNSNHMEGSRLTHEQTRYIFETNTIGVENEVLNVDDMLETANHFRCIDMIIDSAKSALTEKFIKELEFDYVGVIIGDDLRYENGKIVPDFTKRAKTDQSLKGIKKLYKENPKEAENIADELIKNTYRTLMTRGMKGCYVYCTDEKLSEYLKRCLK